MDTSPTISSPHTSKFFQAFAKAQGEFPVIPKDSEVEVYSKPPDRRLLYTYKYADLTTIISCVRPALSKHEIGFTQDYDKEKGLFFTRFLFHGEIFDCGHIPFSPQPNLDMKTIGGLFTYVKRISITAALGVSADEDVDAAHDEGASGNETSKKPSNALPAKPREVKNYAPASSPPPELDNYLDSEPMPDYDVPDNNPLLDELVAVVENKGVPHHEVKKIIKVVCGAERKSTELTDAELIKVIKYISLSWKSKP